MPIFGADHTEPEGSNFLRSAEDFAILRKAIKEIDAEFKKSFKYFKGAFYQILIVKSLLHRVVGRNRGNKFLGHFQVVSCPWFDYDGFFWS